MTLHRKHKQIYHRTSALFLVILLLSIFFIQAAHSHQKDIQKAVTDQEQSDPAPVLCKICDYFIHKQLKDFHLPLPLVIQVAIPKPIQHTHTVVAGIYKFTLQGFTNKGPPLT